MCILFLAKNCHPDYPLIITANRDEYFERPTQASHFWDDDSDLLAGRDLQAGGTWMGLNRQRQLAALTNLRLPHLVKEGAKSRGDIVKKCLQLDSAHLTDWLTQQTTAYNPFNVVWGDQHNLYTFDNVKRRYQTLEDGFHSISNGYMDDYWVKMSRGVQQLQHYLSQTNDVVIDELAELMRNKAQADDYDLPNTQIPYTYEKALSSIFIPATSFEKGVYGTRSTTIVLFTKDQIDWCEYSYDRSGKVTITQSYTL